MPIIVNGSPLEVPGEIELVPDSIQVVGQAVPTGFATTPFDVVIAGVPLFVIIEIICVAAVVLAVLRWFLRLKAMSDVASFKDGGVDVNKGDFILAWILDNVNRLTIRPLNYSAGCIDFTNVDDSNKSIWQHAGRHASLTVGHRSGVLINEGYAYTRSLPVESALMSIISIHNESIADPRRKITSFMDYQEYGRRDLVAKYPKGLPALTYRQLDPKQIDSFMPKGNTAKFFGHMLYFDASELMRTGDKPEGWFAKFTPLLACGVFCAIMLCGAFFFPLGG